MRKIEILTGIVLITFFALSYLHFRTNVAAQISAVGTESDMQSRIRSFFDILTIQPVTPEVCQSAYQKLFSGSSSQDIGVMVQRSEELFKGGNRWQYELLDTKPVGADLMLIRYLTKSETHPVIWYFTFYRSPTGVRTWNCIGVRFDTNLDSLFEESWPK